MSKKMVRAVCIVLAAMLVLGLIAFAIPARAVTQSEIDALEAQRDAIRSQANDIQEQIDTLEDEITSVTDWKAVLDQQTALTSENIRLIDGQIALYDEMIEEKAAEVEGAVAAEEKQSERYRTRVRSMEESNGWSYLSVLLKATSLTDFLSRLNDISDIIRSDQNLKEEYVAAREYVEQVKAEYEEIQEQQKDKRAELGTERERLERQIAQANAVIAQLEDDIEGYESAYEAKENEEAEIQARIDELVAELQKQKEAEEAARRAYEEAQRRQQQQQQSSSSGGGSSSGGTTGAAVNSSGWVWPSGVTYLTSRWGYRIHPIFGTLKNHAGVDVGASYGSTISAAAGGTVQISEHSDSYGNYCVIYHSNGVSTLYAHMNALPVVKVGESVTAGQTIGYVGSTGWANGPHLHFEVRVNGATVDPLDYYPGISFTYAADA